MQYWMHLGKFRFSHPAIAMIKTNDKGCTTIRLPHETHVNVHFERSKIILRECTEAGLYGTALLYAS